VSGFIVVLLYLVAAAAAWHAARRDTPRAAFHESALYLGAAALAAHAAWLYDALETPEGLSLGLADSVSLMGFAIGVGGLCAIFAPRFRTVAAVCLGVAAPLAAGTGSVASPHEFETAGWPLAVHVILAMGSAGMFAVAAILVVLLALQDSALRGRRAGGWLATLPPVESLERALFSVISTGTAALTVAILAGLLFVTDLFAQHLVHKTVLALLAWAIFACLLIGRWRFGWRGRLAARYTIAGFVVLAVAYFGSKFVLEILLGRHWG
jgi:ABC-type uncharacterized transport system permease subunit